MTKEYQFQIFPKNTDYSKLTFDNLLPVPGSLDDEGKLVRKRVISTLTIRWKLNNVGKLLAILKKEECEPDWTGLRMMQGMRHKNSKIQEMLRTSLNHFKITWNHGKDYRCVAVFPSRI